MEVSVRRAAPPDVDEVARLVGAARDAVVGERGGEQWLATSAPTPPSASMLDPGVDRPAWFLGCIDGVPVGVVSATTLRWPDGRLLVRADVLYVEPEAREVGVGEALVDALVALARELGATALESTALPGQRELKNLFERFGLVARAITVHKALPAP